METQQEKAAVGAALFGRRYLDLYRVLVQGGEAIESAQARFSAGQFGFSAAELETIASAETAFARLDRTGGLLGDKFRVGLAPAAALVANEIDGVAASSRALNAALGAGRAIGDAFLGAAGVVSDARGSIDGMTTGWQRFLRTATLTPFAGVLKDIRLARALLDKLAGRGRALRESSEPDTPGGPGAEPQPDNQIAVDQLGLQALARKAIAAQGKEQEQLLRLLRSRIQSERQVTDLVRSQTELVERQARIGRLGQDFRTLVGRELQGLERDAERGAGAFAPRSLDTQAFAPPRFDPTVPARPREFQIAGLTEDDRRRLRRGPEIDTDDTERATQALDGFNRTMDAAGDVVFAVTGRVDTALSRVVSGLRGLLGVLAQIRQAADAWGAIREASSIASAALGSAPAASGLGAPGGSSAGGGLLDREGIYFGSAAKPSAALPVRVVGAVGADIVDIDSRASKSLAGAIGTAAGSKEPTTGAPSEPVGGQPAGVFAEILSAASSAINVASKFVSRPGPLSAGPSFEVATALGFSPFREEPLFQGTQRFAGADLVDSRNEEAIRAATSARLRSQSFESRFAELFPGAESFPALPGEEGRFRIPFTSEDVVLRREVPLSGIPGTQQIVQPISPGQADFPGATQNNFYIQSFDPAGTREIINSKVFRDELEEVSRR